MYRHICVIMYIYYYMSLFRHSIQIIFLPFCAKVTIIRFQLIFININKNNHF